ncbi:MAG: nucleotidyltransferase domain-containing protein [Anaerolineales bacterium]|nr:nucleotidyltransferase domain-containing protein [Anaerolineales bacterium]
MSALESIDKADISDQKRFIRERFPLSKYDIAVFCQRNHIRRLSLFGSVLSEDFTSTSDIDVLVEFEPETQVGFIRFAGLEIELSQLVGREVDIRTPEDLSRYFRQDVMDSAEVQYAAG